MGVGIMPVGIAPVGIAPVGIGTCTRFLLLHNGTHQQCRRKI